MGQCLSRHFLNTGLPPVNPYFFLVVNEPPHVSSQGGNTWSNNENVLNSVQHVFCETGVVDSVYHRMALCRFKKNYASNLTTEIRNSKLSFMLASCSDRFLILLFKVCLFFCIIITMKRPILSLCRLSPKAFHVSHASLSWPR